MLPLGEETAVQAVVGSIVWAFRRLKKPSCREMSARGYAFHSVCPQLSFLSQGNDRIFVARVERTGDLHLGRLPSHSAENHFRFPLARAITMDVGLATAISWLLQPVNLGPNAALTSGIEV